MRRYHMKRVSPGEVIEIFEDAEKRRLFKIKSSEPPELRSIHLGKENIEFKFEDSPLTYTMVGGHPGVIFRKMDGGSGLIATEPGFCELFTPGRSLTII